ncbi:hypothetical protein JXB11_02780 [Candidatus Woesearchaeota archaeon]|nr:hypothetical protein [Candidatus Woesearchaeota archaeon]
MNKRLIYWIVGILAIALMINFYFGSFYSPYKFRGDAPIKIFYLNSYHEFPWADDNIKAFEEVFEKGGIDIEIKRWDMDTLRNTSEQNKMVKGEKAIEMIEEYKPDLIYAEDDHAQEFIAKYVNTETPIVFTGLNEDPAKYGYDTAENVAGVLEELHFADTVNLLKTLYPDEIKRIAVISDDLPQWITVIKNLKEQKEEFPEIEFVGWDRLHKLEEYKSKVLTYQDNVDAIMHLSIVGFVDKDGNNVPEGQVLKWLVENSEIPETTFWDFIVDQGALLSAEVSAKEQGEAGGRLAYAILIDGAEPSSFEFKPTKKSEKAINLARAESLGLKRDDIPSIILVNSKIYERFPWEEGNETAT